ncbi:inositol-1,3,4-trisphosphate 5/6-kinase / inositol-tetrakisphosphate 1-kinase [Mytilus galloprovincialis]|uniref:Inositol-tetrakisphosphate 1-kinase n=2 Tax=Mytilus galloprovincialis TaxID=29158 RepID=A0A8B6BI13_MYTGA|nr:inositol-1,3,4-trisphosphate 5/6-kinase / inositol-tetrakisphosphate 1-kinase [Mytilus galloprovincialis]
MKRVGYWMSQKKNKRLNLEDHKETFRNAGIDLVKFDIDQSLTEQGPFDLILHKCTGLMVAAKDGDLTAECQINNIKDYIEKNPGCIIVDKFEHINHLLDRNYQYQLLLQCHLLDSDSPVFTPSFVNLTTADTQSNIHKLREANVTYPFVCKPIVAHGKKESHQMSIIFDDYGLTDIQPPCVAQSFINHNAVLYKVFIIGDQQFIVERPSIKNLLPRGQATIHFDSNDVSKPNSSSFLTELDQEDVSKIPFTPDYERLRETGLIIQRQLKMDLFGIDVIVDCDSGRYAVIDINAFPGYEGVDNFVEVLCNYLINRMSCNETVSSDAEQYSDAEKQDQNKPKRLKVCSEHCMMYKCQKEPRNTEGFGYSSDSMTSDAESQDETPWKQPIKRCSKHCQKQ